MPAYTQLSEEELLQRCKKNDEAAFTEIYNRYWEKLLAIGYYYTHNKADAEDIVHDVMISLWNRKNEIQIQSLDAYLATAVKFSVFKAIARQRRNRELMDTNKKDTGSYRIDAALEARFMEEYLSGTIEKLPEKTRIVFTFRRKEELSVIEIANKLELSPKAVEYHITKALRAIRNALSKINFFFL